MHLLRPGALLLLHGVVCGLHRALVLSLRVRPLTKVESDHDVTLLCELDGVVQRVQEHLLHAHGVAHDALRDALVHVVAHVELQPGRVQTDNLHHRCDHRLRMERLVSKHQLVRLYPRKVENIRDERLQGLAGAANGGYVIALDAVEVGVLQELAHGDQAVEGRSNFVRHVRQKL